MGGGKVGSNCDILHSAIDLSAPWLISIGNNVTITGAELLVHDASMKKALGYTKFGHVSIGNDCFIGVRSVILPNVTIEDKVIVGAGCVIAKDIPPNSVVVGNPARIVGTFDDFLKRHQKEMKTHQCFDMLPRDIAGQQASKDVEPYNDVFYAR